MNSSRITTVPAVRNRRTGSQIFLYRSQTLVNQNVNVKVLKTHRIIESVQVLVLVFRALAVSLQNRTAKYQSEQVKSTVKVGLNCHHSAALISLIDEYFIFCFLTRWCGIKTL